MRAIHKGLLILNLQSLFYSWLIAQQHVYKTNKTTSKNTTTCGLVRGCQISAAPAQSVHHHILEATASRPSECELPQGV